MHVCVCVCLLVCVYNSGRVSHSASLGTSLALRVMEACLPSPHSLPMADVHSGKSGWQQSPQARHHSPLWLLLAGYLVTPVLGLSSVLPRRVAPMPGPWSSLGSHTPGASEFLGPRSLHAYFITWVKGLWLPTPSSTQVSNSSPCGPVSENFSICPSYNTPE